MHDDEQTKKFREAVQRGWWWIIEEAHFEILDAEQEIWFAWVHTPEEPDHSFPIIGRGRYVQEYVRLTSTALTNLMGGTV